MFRQASKSVYTSNIVSPDPFPPTPSTSSALKTPENTEEDPEDAEPADMEITKWKTMSMLISCTACVLEQ
jgi:hypothetical protein